MRKISPLTCRAGRKTSTSSRRNWRACVGKSRNAFDSASSSSTLSRSKNSDRQITIDDKVPVQDMAPRTATNMARGQDMGIIEAGVVHKRLCTPSTRLARCSLLIPFCGAVRTISCSVRSEKIFQGAPQTWQTCCQVHDAALDCLHAVNKYHQKEQKTNMIEIFSSVPHTQ
jgi:hypothetical protein